MLCSLEFMNSVISFKSQFMCPILEGTSYDVQLGEFIDSLKKTVALSP